MDFYLVYLAKDALTTKRGSMDELAAASLLTAHLQDAPILADGLHELLSFEDGERERLLEIDILACLTSGDGDDGVLMVGCSDNHSVDVLSGQQVLVVLIDIHLHLLLALRPVELLHSTLEAVALDVIDIAASQHTHVVERHEGAQQIHRLLPKPDETQVDFPVGRRALLDFPVGRLGRSCRLSLYKTHGRRHCHSTQSTCSQKTSSFHNLYIFELFLG